MTGRYKDEIHRRELVCDCGLIVYTELEEHCPALMGDMTDRNTEEFDKEENK